MAPQHATHADGDHQHHTGEAQWPRKSPPRKREQEAVGVPSREPPAADKVTPVTAGTQASRQLCQAIAEQSGGTCLLAFSRGKDSLAAWWYLRQFFPRIIPFHGASVPHLAFVDDSLAYYEEVFATRIHRFLSGDVTGAIDALVYQSPDAEPDIDALELWDYDTNAIADHLRQTYHLSRAWCAYGINQTDSIDRRIYVAQYQGRIDAHQSFYPCFDWTRAMILGVLQHANIALPKDYLMYGRTVVGVPMAQHLAPMADVCPDDYARVLTLFPFAEADLARHAFRREKWDRDRSASRLPRVTAVTHASATDTEWP